MAMNQILQTGESFISPSFGLWEVEECLGSGSQGEVYRVSNNGCSKALKFYYPIHASVDQRKNLELLIGMGSPTNKFLWPEEIITVPFVQGFGYLMPLRKSGYVGLSQLLKRHIEPTFRALITAGFELSNNFLQLHSKGFCYRDIHFENVFFDPQTGEVLICDNDNVTLDGNPYSPVYGAPGFIAPEILRGEAPPSTQTDLFSLSVLLFYLLMMHHPLEGQKELEIRCFDWPAMVRLFGEEPVFIFDPHNTSNRPVPGYHDNALVFWPLYPRFIREL